MQEFRKTHSNIGFDIEQAKSNHLLRFLKEGVSDLTFVRSGFGSLACPGGAIVLIVASFLFSFWL